MTVGIYEIVNVLNGHRYIGQSIDIARRWRQHRNYLARGTANNPRLQRAWNKYGNDAFTFNVIGECVPHKAALTFFENVALKAVPHEYNICEAAESVLGIKRTPEQIAAMSERMQGKKQPPRKPETCAQISARMKGNTYSTGVTHWRGRKHTAEAIAKMSAASKGRIRSPFTAETRAKMSAAQLGNKKSFGHRHSLEARAKMGIARKGKKLGPTSAEHRAKQSMALKGKPWSSKRRAAENARQQRVA